MWDDGLLTKQQKKIVKLNENKSQKGTATRVGSHINKVLCIFSSSVYHIYSYNTTIWFWYFCFVGSYNFFTKYPEIQKYTDLSNISRAYIKTILQVTPTQLHHLQSIMVSFQVSLFNHYFLQSLYLCHIS